MVIRQSHFLLLPNLLTLSRVITIPIIIVLLYYSWSKLAFVVFLLSGLSDYVDGWLARRHNTETKLGMLLDPLADKLIILSVMIMLLWMGRLDFLLDGYNFELFGPLLVIVTVGREIGITGLRSIASTAGIVMPADKAGKLKTWLQFVAMSALILGYGPLLPTGQVLLSISVLIALWSGVRYVYYFLKKLPE